MNVKELKRWPFPDQEFLGRGSFGNVRRGLYCKAPVAVKELLTGNEQPPAYRRQAKTELLQEIRVLMKLRHPNIVCMIAYDSRYIIMDMYKGNAVKLKSVEEVGVVGRDCMRGIAYMQLHGKCVLHGDIKPENILVNIDSYGNIVKAALGDLGFARSCAKFFKKTTFVGTPGYMPMPNPVVDSTHDIYALAVSLLDGFLSQTQGDVHARNEYFDLDDNTMDAVSRFPDEDCKNVISDMLIAYENRSVKRNTKKRTEFIEKVVVQWENIVSSSNVAAPKITSYPSLHDT